MGWDRSLGACDNFKGMMKIAFKRGKNCHLNLCCALRSFSSGPLWQSVTSGLVGQIMRVILEHYGGIGEKTKERAEEQRKSRKREESCSLSFLGIL